MKNVRAVVAEYERLKINERMVRGRRQKARSGSVMVSGHAPYGYKTMKVADKTTLQIDDEKAAVVRLIFDWYVNGGLTLRAISDRLAEVGAPLPSGIRKNTMGWLASSVCKMIKNETYAGVWHFGKYNKRGGNKTNPREHWIPVEVQAIVSREVWQAAQSRLAENKANARRNMKYDYLVSKRVTCGECGCKCSGKSNGKYLYYVCNSYNNRETRPRGCSLRHVRAGLVDSAVWSWVANLLTDPEALEAGFEEYQTRRDEEDAPLLERLEVTDRLLADSRIQLDRLLGLYLAEDFPKELLIERMKHLETAKDALEKEQAATRNRLDRDRLTEEQVQTIKDFAVEVGEGLEAADFALRRRVIELLDVQVTLTREDGHHVVYARCRLGSGLPGGCDPSHQCLSSLKQTVWLSIRLIIGHHNG